MTRPKQERAVRTREAILTAAAEVFDEFGYSAAGVSRILQRAGVTQGAMYFHFKSKEDLGRSVLVEQASTLNLPDEPAGLQQLIDVTLYLGFELKRNVLLRAGVRLAVEQGEAGLRDFTVYRWWIARFRAELDVAERRGELLPQVDGAEFARVLVGAFTGTQLMSHLENDREDLPAQIAVLWNYLLPGVATPAVLARLTVDVERGKAML
ncbi:butyrolactone receptor [Streptomyces lincolnensis]|uniref:Butyrolactone receptor n=1 Tax=Streptomyces lincolnensis TaxID=1915 RepID=A0A1B1MFN0_STRLN|nr:ScbR family autoregulator-binding transcription factor [Streptomyces lincolnensis]ANS67317.1 butyrolactone receptor [Streptomyces lincolnensis]AXG56188.1 butyrolactone receptor [Streptomyces lincolnensis]QMV07349.1 TetR family transcriptional regulator [Streptomyces lincolnensis]